MNEVFVDVESFNIKPGMYSVSNTGKVLSKTTGKELSQIMMDGYKFVGVQTDSGRRTIGVHRLVASAFIPKTEEDVRIGRDFVNHKDLDRTNNMCTNLEWVTNLENINHAYVNDAIRKSRKEKLSKSGMYNVTVSSKWGNSETVGERNGMSRITERQAHIICKSLENGSTNRQAAINAGLEGTVLDSLIVSFIRRGIRWKHVSSHYKIGPKYTKKKDISSELNPHINKILIELVKGTSIRDIYNSIKNMADENFCKYRDFYNFVYRIKKGKTLNRFINNLKVEQK